MNKVCCLTCQFARWPAPADWKPRWEGASFDFNNVASLMRETKPRQHYKGECTFNPVWLEINTGHWCGQWQAVSEYIHPNEADYTSYVWGTYASRHYNQLEEDNKTLRRQLKKVREISASRLTRLQKNGKAADT